jgi:hypothetical protein
VLSLSHKIWNFPILNQTISECWTEQNKTRRKEREAKQMAKQAWTEAECELDAKESD